MIGMKRVIGVLCCVLLAGCQDMDFVMIQYKYEQMRDECRDLSELKYDLYSSGGGGATNARDLSSSLTALYNDCMYSQGWNMTSQVKEPKKQPSSSMQ